MSLRAANPRDTESAPLLPSKQSPNLANAPAAYVQFASPDPLAASPESGSFSGHALDAWLPTIRGRPFTYRLSANISAGLTVALINIPLSLALAVASGSTPQVGMLTAVWGGLFAAMLGGSQFNIQGPTGALSGMLARYAVILGPSILPILSITSGLLILLAFFFSLDRFVTFLPSSVAHGFTLGVAAIIAIGQVGSAFALPPIPVSAVFLENIATEVRMISNGYGSWHACGICMVTWVILFSLIRRWPRIPWMVPIACAGALLGWLSEQGFGSRLTVLKDKYGDLHMPLFVLPQWEADVSQARPIFVASVSIAFVAVLESLISGKIADGMTKTTMQSRQEVFATAAANIAAGVAGGLPTTAALARTALNINAGATSRLSGVFNAVFTLLIGMFALPLFGHLPLCIVAAMLFQVAVAMVDLKHLKHALVLDRGAFFLTLLVGALCVIFDPTEAIVIGGAIGLLRIIESIATGYGEVTISRDLQSADRLDLIAFDSAAAASVDEGMVINAWRRLVGRSRQSTQQSLEATLDREREKPLAVSTDLTHGTHAAPADLTDTVIYRVVGALTYIDGLRHCRRLRRFDASKHLIVSFRFCRYVDLDGLDALEECLGEVMQAKRSVEMNNNGSGGARSYAVLLAGIQPGSVVNTLLSKSVWFQRDFVDRGRVFASVEDAVAFLRQASSSSSAQGPAAQGNALPNGLSSSTDMPAGANNFSASTPSGRRAVAAAARRNIDEDVY